MPRVRIRLIEPAITKTLSKYSATDLRLWGCPVDNQNRRNGSNCGRPAAKTMAEAKIRGGFLAKILNWLLRPKTGQINKLSHEVAVIAKKPVVQFVPFNGFKEKRSCIR